MSEVPSPQDRPDNDPAGSGPRIGILVVAYNAVSTLARTLDRIPVDFRSRIAEVLICDDASDDHTYLLGLGYQQVNTDLPITVIRHETNLGYGGNQKAGYQLAIELDLDIIVLLHGDGQYAPEMLPEMVAPLERGECDAVFGSRMMNKGAARAGGMPLYKYVGNRILTTIENRVIGSTLSEFHSGYRAYSVRTLRELDLSATSDGFNFDTEIIIALHSRKKKILEIPIPTYYGDEISYVNGLAYARDVITDVAVYRLATLGFSPGELTQIPAEYALKESEGSSHDTVLALTADAAPGRVLDIGCSGGQLSQLFRSRGHHVTGVDMIEHPETAGRLDVFMQADLDQGLPAGVGEGYDIVVVADVLEHLRDPDKLLRQIAGVLDTSGRLMISVPNFGHWYPRLRAMFGIFDYDQRGILDKTHLRFYTRRSLLRSVKKNGFTVHELRATGLPIDALGAKPSLLRRIVVGIDKKLVALRPTLFGYQFVLDVRPVQPRRSITFARQRT